MKRRLLSLPLRPTQAAPLCVSEAFAKTGDALIRRIRIAKCGKQARPLRLRLFCV